MDNEKASLLNDVTFKMFTSKITTIIIDFDSLIKLSNRYITLSNNGYNIWDGNNKLKEDTNIKIMKSISSILGITKIEKTNFEKLIDKKMKTNITKEEFVLLSVYIDAVVG